MYVYRDGRIVAYIIFLIGPVHPVFPLWIPAASVPETVFDGKLQKENTLLDLMQWLNMNYRDSSPKNENSCIHIVQKSFALDRVYIFK